MPPVNAPQLNAVDITAGVKEWMRQRGIDPGALQEIKLTVGDIPLGQRLLGEVLQDAVAFAPRLVMPHTPIAIDGVRWAVFIPGSAL